MVIGLDKDKKRVSLGLKHLSKDPWETVEADFPVGTTVKGVIKRTVDFGAFVELKPGVEGLIHVSQIATKRITRPSDVVKEGQEVEAKVLSIDLEKKRISLSMAEIERAAKIASGEIPAPEAVPAAAGKAPAAPAGKPKPRKNLKGGL
jgi:small subunit ribosomal protein S1